MKPVVWSEQALSDLKAIKEYISHDSPDYAKVYVRKLVEKGDTVNVFPDSGRIVPEENISFIREVFHVAEPKIDNIRYLVLSIIN